MNETYYQAKQIEHAAPRLTGVGVQTDRAGDRNPMLPLLLNDISAATDETVALIDQLEKQLDPITAMEDGVIPPPENKEPTCFPPALEMLRGILRRSHAINRRLSSLRRRVEL